MDLLYFSVLPCARLFICALWSPAGKGLTSWLSFVVSNCEFVTFPLVNLGQVWYLIVSIPDLCTLSYFDIENSIPDSRDCKDSKYCYQPAGHIVTGHLKTITDSRIRSIICKGPKYRFPLPKDFKSCREEIAGALQEFCYCFVSESKLRLMP